MVKAVNISKLVYNSDVVVGYRFKLSDGSYVDTDSETFNWCNRLFKIIVSVQIPVYLVNGECKSKSEIESKITVKDASENSELVTEYLNQIEDYRYNELKSKESSTLHFVEGSTPKKGYLRFDVSDADSFIEAFKGLGLTKEMLIFNIERYGLENDMQYILSNIPREY